VSSTGSDPSAPDVGAQVLIEVRLRAVEGDLSDHARRELIERNLAVLEPLVASLRCHVVPRSKVVPRERHVLRHIRRHVIDPLRAGWWTRRVSRSPGSARRD
jgi:hypothetical protein